MFACILDLIEICICFQAGEVHGNNFSTPDSLPLCGIYWGCLIFYLLMVNLSLASLIQTTGICCHWTSLFQLDFSDVDGPPQTASSKGLPSYLIAWKKYALLLILWSTFFIIWYIFSVAWLWYCVNIKRDYMFTKPYMGTVAFS